MIVFRWAALASSKTFLAAIAASLLAAGPSPAETGSKFSKAGGWVFIEAADLCTMFLTYDAAALYVTYDKDDLHIDLTSDAIHLKEGDYRYGVLLSDKKDEPTAYYEKVLFHADPPNEGGRTFLKAFFDAELLDDIGKSQKIYMVKDEKPVVALNLEDTPPAVKKFKGCVETLLKARPRPGQ